MSKKLVKQLGDIIADAGISYDPKDILILIEVTNRFNRSGYKLTYNEVAKFLVNDKNKKMIESEGLTKTIEAMANMRLGTITRSEPKTGRNDKCICGSGAKYKKCCLNKS